MLGFVEFNTDYCDDDNSGLTRTVDLQVKSCGEKVIEEQVNVAELTDRCCKAHIITLTITPKSKNIDIDITKGNGSHGLPILSLIQIQPSTERR
jgi:hypothetical protein